MLRRKIDFERRKACGCVSGILCSHKQLRRRSPQSIRQASQRQEREIARDYQQAGIESARRVILSGAAKGFPGDIEVGDLFLGEAKYTRTGKLTIRNEWIDKIENQAKQSGKQSWIIHAWVAEGNSNFRKVVILDEDFFFDLLVKR